MRDLHIRVSLENVKNAPQTLVRLIGKRCVRADREIGVPIIQEASHRARCSLMKKLFCIVALGLLFKVPHVSALTFNLTYDSSVTSQTNAADIEAGVAAAAQTFEDLYTNVATINISVYWGATGPFAGGTVSLGQSMFNLIQPPPPFGYSDVVAALTAARASDADTNSVASLPATDPTGGEWWLPYPEARVLGFVDPDDPTEDGEITFATDVSFAFDPNNRAVAGKYDFIAVAQHEISEVMGRCTLNLDGNFVPYDLFRFTNNDVRCLDPNATNVYFSVDNGATALKFFYTNVNFGDIQDWVSGTTPDAFDAFSRSGRLNPLSTADITAMDVLGYNGAPLLAPRLVATNSGNGNFRLSFYNSPGVRFTVLASTNLTTRLANWTVLGTATEGPAGQFTFTDTTATNQNRFYIVRSP